MDINKLKEEYLYNNNSDDKIELLKKDIRLEEELYRKTLKKSLIMLIASLSALFLISGILFIIAASMHENEKAVGAIITIEIINVSICSIFLTKALIDKHNTVETEASILRMKDDLNKLILETKKEKLGNKSNLNEYEALKESFKA